MSGFQRSALHATIMHRLLGRHNQVNDPGGHEYFRIFDGSTASQSEFGDSTVENFGSQGRNIFPDGSSTIANDLSQPQAQDSSEASYSQALLWFGATITLAFSGILAVAYHVTKETKWELASYNLLLLAEIYALVLPAFRSCICILKRRVCFLFLNFLSLLFCPAAWMFWHFGLDSWTHLSIRISEIILTFAIVHLAVAASTKPTLTSPHAIRDVEQGFDYSSTGAPIQFENWVGTYERHEDIAVRLSLPIPVASHGGILVEIKQE